MRSRVTFLTIIALIAALPAVAQIIFVPIYTPPPTPKVSAGEYTNIQKVAVISAIGTNLRVGAKLLAKGKTANIDDWNVDDQVVSTVQQLLASRFQFKNVAYDRQVLAAMPNGVLDDSRAELLRYLGTLPKDDIDAFLVIRPGLASGAPGAGGLSLLNNAVNDGRPGAFANYEIYVVDARSLKIVATSYSRVQQRPGRSDFAGLLLIKQLAYDEKTLELTADQRKAMRAVYYRLIPLSLLETLRPLEMGATLPAVGGRSLVARPPDTRPYGEIKSIAVISTIGDDLVLQHFGDSYITSSTEHLNIDDWRLDEAIEAQARDAIGTQFTIKNVAVDMSQLRQAGLVDDKLSYNPDLRGLTATEDVDAYLVFLKHRFQFRGSNTQGKGAGIVRFASLFSGVTNVFAYYDVALVDAHSLKVIRASSAVIDPSFTNASPSTSVESALWPASAKQMTAQQKEKVRALISGFLSQSVKETLLRLNLTNMMIVDSWPLPTENTMDVSSP